MGLKNFGTLGDLANEVWTGMLAFGPQLFVTQKGGFEQYLH